MSAFKVQQRLVTRVPLKGEDGSDIAPRTRVVVMSTLEDGRVKVKTLDGNVRTAAKPGAFQITLRGRPRKDGNPVRAVKQLRAARDAGITVAAE